MEPSTKKNIDMEDKDINMDNDETLAELKAAAFEVLLLNPGSEMADWQQTHGPAIRHRSSGRIRAKSPGGICSPQRPVGIAL